MMQWIMGLNAINSLAKTLMLVSRKKTEESSLKGNPNNFYEILKSELSVKELTKEKAEKIVSLYDINQDKKISVRESGLSVQEFQQWDMNKDEYVTAQEIQILWSHLGPFTNVKD